ncbi:MAG: hypothetical protein OEM00_11570 [Burkholderiaceae bacterium]|nr:hypothetical protein [Burkholderiaceae bacterium]
MSPRALYAPSSLMSFNPPDLSSASFRFLAEGDSWFSLGTLNLAKNSNLLHEMAFERICCEVNSA